MAKFNLWNFNTDKKQIKELYTDISNLTVIEFANRTDIIKFVWVEPTCVSIELDSQTEYQIVTHDRTFLIEFDTEETTVFYLQSSFGFILNKRPTSSNAVNPNKWTLDLDCSDIN